MKTTSAPLALRRSVDRLQFNAKSSEVGNLLSQSTRKVLRMLASCWSMVDWARGIEPAVVVNAASVRALIHFVCQMRRRSFWRAVMLCGEKIGVKELTGNKHVVDGWFLHFSSSRSSVLLYVHRDRTDC